VRGEKRQELAVRHGARELLREEIISMQAYEVHDSTGMVKLDAMENPYALPPGTAAQIGAAARGLALNRYPDPRALELKRVLRTVMRVPHDADILIGNGSDELIQILALALAKPEAIMMSVAPSFVMYERIARYVGMRFVGVPLNRDFSLDVERLLESIDEHRPAILFLAYPNNPTGTLYDRESVLRVIDENPGLTVLDEAYHPFAQTTFMDEVAKHANLIVMRTLSKVGLAGLRLGFLVGSREWLSELDKLRLPYNVNAFSQVAAVCALRDEEGLLRQADAIRADRDAMLRQLRERAITAFDSAANFILFKLARADEIFLALKTHGVLIKNLNNSHPMLENCLRVTVGTPDENAKFLAVLDQSLRKTG
jgi:histidinol-phosphate aminotransferase